MQREYVLATGNPGKLREMADMFKPFGLVVRAQGDWQVPEARETAETFVENALIKARQAAKYTSLPSIADDSGLVVPALDGQPGIFSARYAGEKADAEANMDKLLAEMQGLTSVQRNAYFYCVMVQVNTHDDPAPLIATGRWQGRILSARRGVGGFGYDPVFGVMPRTGAGVRHSAAEMTAVEKNHVSHRGEALRELARQLHERFS